VENSDAFNRLKYNTIPFYGAFSRPDLQGARSDSCGFCFSRSEANLFAGADEKTKRTRRSRVRASWVRRRAKGSPKAIQSWQVRRFKC
jgi:hypothetical protein